MKILILKNKIKTSIKQLDDIKDFFKDVEDIQFTEEYVSFNFPNGEYSYYDLQGELKTYKAVDETWYDENISKPSKARGFDCVIFLIKPNKWVASFIDGFGTSTPDWDIEEIAVKYYTSGKFNFMGVKLKGNKLYWIIVHEILHRLYNMRKLPDNTHKYFLEANPYKCLEDFKEPKMKTWKHFKLKEKTGSLGHTIADLDTNLVDKLDIVRELCGFPFIITSGYRTVAENIRVGGVAGSAHTKRLAVDIFCNDASKRMKIIEHAFNNGFIGVGIHSNFVHLDLDTSKERRVWLY